MFKRQVHANTQSTTQTQVLLCVFTQTHANCKHLLGRLQQQLLETICPVQLPVNQHQGGDINEKSDNAISKLVGDITTGGSEPR